MIGMCSKSEKKNQFYDQKHQLSQNQTESSDIWFGFLFRFGRANLDILRQKLKVEFSPFSF